MPTLDLIEYASNYVHHMKGTEVDCVLLPLGHSLRAEDFIRLEQQVMLIPDLKKAAMAKTLRMEARCSTGLILEKGFNKARLRSLLSWSSALREHVSVVVSPSPRPAKEVLSELNHPLMCGHDRVEVNFDVLETPKEGKRSLRAC